MNSSNLYANINFLTFADVTSFQNEIIKHSMDTLMVKCYVKFRCGFMMSLVTVCFGSVLEERVGGGEVGGHSHDMPCTWRLSWLAVERPWLALAWSFLYTNRCRNHFSAFVGAPFLAL